MEVVEAVKKLEKSKEFKAFKKKQDDYYLVHAFTMDAGDKQDFQLGYYSKKTDKVIVFEIGNKIVQAPEQEVLKKKKVVKPLDLEKIRLNPEGALKASINTMEEFYGKEPVTKKIVILQNLESKNVYNVTLVTSSFNIVNIKLSAATGRILKKSKQSIMALGKTMS